jgi:hypothetical protein
MLPANARAIHGAKFGITSVMPNFSLATRQARAAAARATGNQRERVEEAFMGV